MITGKCVALRRMTEQDADIVVRWRSDPEVQKQMFSRDAPSQEEHLQWMARILARGEREEFIIEDKQRGQAVGTIGLSQIDHDHRHAEYGILIGEVNARGQGYAREASELILAYAFEQLGLHRVYLHVFDDNLAAIRLYRKLGFEHEGVLRQHICKDGAFRNVCAMGILRQEWAGQVGR